jgi:hypothetical protein
VVYVISDTWKRPPMAIVFVRWEVLVSGAAVGEIIIVACPVQWPAARAKRRWNSSADAAVGTASGELGAPWGLDFRACCPCAAWTSKQLPSTASTRGFINQQVEKRGASAPD